jgi:hypothetical protein
MPQTITRLWSSGQLVTHVTSLKTYARSKEDLLGLPTDQRYTEFRDLKEYRIITPTWRDPFEWFREDRASSVTSTHLHSDRGSTDPSIQALVLEHGHALKRKVSVQNCPCSSTRLSPKPEQKSKFDPQHLSVTIHSSDDVFILVEFAFLVGRSSNSYKSLSLRRFDNPSVRARNNLSLFPFISLSLTHFNEISFFPIEQPILPKFSLRDHIDHVRQRRLKEQNVPPRHFD